ncbi:MAG: SH3 domain-containing protein [Lachnospiraceae bacterium]|nr:SH3 domain-containing protein [Lachnospiraceae bacterium]
MKLCGMKRGMENSNCNKQKKYISRAVLTAMMAVVLFSSAPFTACATEAATLLDSDGGTYEQRNATVTGGDINVRSGAGTTFDAITKAANGTAVVITGEEADSDGKTWYQVNITVDGSEKTGYIRNDFLELGDVIAPEVPETETAEETQETETTEEVPVNNDYAVEYIQGEDGTLTWYLDNNQEGVRYKISELMEASKLSAADAENSQSGRDKIIIIVLFVLVAILVITVTLLLFKLHSAYEEEEENEEYFRRNAKRPVDKRVAERTPERKSRERQEAGRGDSSGNRTRRDETRRSSEDGERRRRPATEAERRPVRDRAEDRPVRRSTGGQPAGRNAGAPDRAVRPSRPARPVEDLDSRDEYDERSQDRAAQTRSKKAKNFLADDDDFEYNFFDLDD